MYPNYHPRWFYQLVWRPCYCVYTVAYRTRHCNNCNALQIIRWSTSRKSWRYIFVAKVTTNMELIRLRFNYSVVSCFVFTNGSWGIKQQYAGKQVTLQRWIVTFAQYRFTALVQRMCNWWNSKQCFTLTKVSNVLIYRSLRASMKFGRMENRS